jgi:hypothetical protein
MNIAIAMCVALAAGAAALPETPAFKMAQDRTRKAEPGWHLEIVKLRPAGAWLTCVVETWSPAANESLSAEPADSLHRKIKIRHFEFPSEAAAREGFRRSGVAVSVGAVGEMNLCDESQVWLTGGAVIHCRKGSTLLKVSAPSRELAERFTRHRLEALEGRVPEQLR